MDIVLFEQYSVKDKVSLKELINIFIYADNLCMWANKMETKRKVMQYETKGCY